MGADRSWDRVGQDDLEFIKDLKKVQSKKNITSNPSSKDLQIYLGMRRNSSFAEYFEGDLSQNLLSRSHFPRRDSAAAVKSDAVDAIVKQIRTEDTNNNLGLGITKGEGGEGRKKKLSQLLLPSNWFFKNTGPRKTSLPEKPQHRRRPTSEGGGGEDEGGESLSQIVSQHFSATTDIRAWNINTPQSQ